MSSPITWTSRTSAADNNWTSVTYGNGLFVAVASSGSNNRVMTSPDGITWTSRTSAADYFWESVTYGNGLFVAVASSGTGNRVMTSTDGIIWTSRTSVADYNWSSVTYGNGKFVAVCILSGSGDRVMTSLDGITWSLGTSAADYDWISVTYGNNLFVAVSYSGTYQVMTSPDGTTNWSLKSSASNNLWESVTYGNGLFVAVSQSGSNNRVMTSPDGTNWTSRTSAADNNWRSVTYGNGLFVAVSEPGSNQVMTSPDGITWSLGSSSANNSWKSVIYGNGLFVAVSYSGTGNRVMTGSFPFPCFKEDSFILTNKGYLPIQDLRKGDLVKTLKHGYKPIEMIGKREMYHPANFKDRIKDQLYTCSRSEFPEVFEPLIITGCHSILVENSTSVVNAEQIEKVKEVNGCIYLTDDMLRIPACVDLRTTVYEIPGTYTIYHLALENNNYYMNYGIYANGLLVESCSKRYLRELSKMWLIE